MRGESYIKLFRKITEWEHYQDGNTMRLFLHLLINAVHNKQYYYGIPLNRGQYYTTSRTLSKELDLCTNCITRSIKLLRDSGDIETEKYGNGTIFTIVHYNDYQSSDKAERNGSNKPEQPKGNGIGRTDF